LLGLIANEILVMSSIFLMDALETPLETGGFIQDNVVSHRRSRVR
jgi:hypothetical protein